LREVPIIRDLGFGVKLDFLTHFARRPYDAQDAPAASLFLAVFRPMLSLRYGSKSCLNLELASPALVALCDAPRGTPLTRVADAVRSALDAPLDYPPLAQAALPGDRVVLALEEGVPQAAAIIAQTIDQLLKTGVDAEDIVLLRSRDEPGEPHPLEAVSSDVRDAVACVVHDPANRDALSYLAATADARPIYVNRLIHDADLVISIGVLRLPEALGYHGVNSALFPAFSDAASLERYRSPKSTTPAHRQDLVRQADEVGWLLGLQFTIQIVPGRAGEVLHVIAGGLDAVRVAGQRLCEAAWAYEVSEPAGLVLAALEGDAGEQTWQNVGRLLSAASPVLDDDGAIVILSELAQTPGAGLQRVQGADDLNRALHDLVRDRPADALESSQLIHALRRGKVYLLSRLPDEVVEDLGMLPVQPAGVARIVARHRTFIVLANAQYTQARLAPSALTAPAGPHPARS
jgi:nickel-dependent lactate racemase